ncbi:MAG: hypothetical protein WC905_02330 [Patescibacteria group bacterium]|jgi:hypothetical protein
MKKEKADIIQQALKVLKPFSEEAKFILGPSSCHGYLKPCDWHQLRKLYLDFVKKGRRNE